MEKKKSPQNVKVRVKSNQHHHHQLGTSDSDGSVETNSLSADSATEQPANNPPKPPTRKKSRRRSSEWEIMEGLKDGQKFDKKPSTFNGYLHKKRKWPLKGWHKVRTSYKISIDAFFNRVIPISEKVHFFS